MEQSDIYIYHSEDDPEPGKYAKKSKWKHMVKDIIVKKFRPYIVYVLDKLGVGK